MPQKCMILANSEQLLSFMNRGKKGLRETALEWLGDFGLLSIDEEPLPNPNADQTIPTSPDSTQFVNTPSTPSPVFQPPAHPTPYTPTIPSTSVPVVNPAITWAPPTSIKSELIGDNDDISLDDAPALIAVGDTMYDATLGQPYPVLLLNNKMLLDSAQISTIFAIISRVKYCRTRENG